MSLPLIHLSELDSTQAFLARHPELGCCAVMADAQTAGRGRGENRWESAPGAGLWLSAAIEAPDLQPGLLLQRAMLAVIEALEPCGVVLGLKWPNDLVARHAGHLVKVGGIIGEMKGPIAILGLGINLRAAPSIPARSIPPACLQDLSDVQIPEAADLARTILALWQDLSVTRVPPFRWPEPGDPVRWDAVEGVCEAWMEDGRLAVRTAHGCQQLCAGDLT